MFHIIEIKDNQSERYISKITSKKEFIDWVKIEYCNNIEYIESSFNNFNRNVGVYLLFDGTYYYYINITRLNTKKGNEMIISSKINFLKTWKLVEDYTENDKGNNVEAKITALINRVSELEAKNCGLKQNSQQDIENNILNNIYNKIEDAISFYFKSTIGLDISNIKIPNDRDSKCVEISNVKTEEMLPENYGKLSDREINEFCQKAEENTNYYCNHLIYINKVYGYYRIDPSFFNLKNVLHSYINDFKLKDGEYIIHIHQNIFYHSKNIDKNKHGNGPEIMLLRYGVCFINIITNLGNFTTHTIYAKYESNSFPRVYKDIHEKLLLVDAQNGGANSRFKIMDCSIKKYDEYNIIKNKFLDKKSIDLIKKTNLYLIEEDIIPNNNHNKNKVCGNLKFKYAGNSYQGYWLDMSKKIIMKHSNFSFYENILG